MQTITFRQLLINYMKRHPVTFWLLIANLAMFIIMSFGGGFDTAVALEHYGALKPSLVNDGQFWRIFTFMFLHGGFFHFFMNSIFLYYIGGSMEKIIGSKKYAVLYFISGIGSGIAIWLFDTSGLPTVGASGALYGVMAGLFLLTFLRKPWFHPRTISSIRFMVAINVFFTISSILSDGSISFWGHLGGFVVGLAIFYFLTPNKPPTAHRHYGPRPTRNTSHHGRTVIDADSVTEKDIYDSHYTN